MLLDLLNSLRTTSSHSSIRDVMPEPGRKEEEAKKIPASPKPDTAAQNFYAPW